MNQHQRYFKVSHCSEYQGLTEELIQQRRKQIQSPNQPNTASSNAPFSQKYNVGNLFNANGPSIMGQPQHRISGKSVPIVAPYQIHQNTETKEIRLNSEREPPQSSNLCNFTFSDQKKEAIFPKIQQKQSQFQDGGTELLNNESAVLGEKNFHVGGTTQNANTLVSTNNLNGDSINRSSLAYSNSSALNPLLNSSPKPHLTFSSPQKRSFKIKQQHSSPLKSILESQQYGSSSSNCKSLNKQPTVDGQSHAYKAKQRKNELLSYKEIESLLNYSKRPFNQLYNKKTSARQAEDFSDLIQLKRPYQNQEQHKRGQSTGKVKASFIPKSSPDRQDLLSLIQQRSKELVINTNDLQLRAQDCQNLIKNCSINYTAASKQFNLTKQTKRHQAKSNSPQKQHKSQCGLSNLKKLQSVELTPRQTKESHFYVIPNITYESIINNYPAQLVPDYYHQKADKSFQSNIDRISANKAYVEGPLTLRKEHSGHKKDLSLHQRSQHILQVEINSQQHLMQLQSLNHIIQSQKKVNEKYKLDPIEVANSRQMVDSIDKVSHSMPQHSNQQFNRLEQQEFVQFSPPLYRKDGFNRAKQGLVSLQKDKGMEEKPVPLLAKNLLLKQEPESLYVRPSQFQSPKHETKITIKHVPSTHLEGHPINKAIKKINYIIRLIFKSHKEQVPGQGNGLTGAPFDAFKDKRFQEIQRVSKTFGMQIPKKFDTKTAQREYFCSREFIVMLKTRMNSTLNSAINETNGMSDLIQLVQQQAQQNTQVTQKFFVDRGNNAAIVRSVLKQRYWWIQHQEEDFENVSFVWTSWKKQKHIDYLTHRGLQNFEKGIRFYNRMEQNKQLTNKKGVFINMRNYYQAKGEDPFQVLPLTFLVKQGQADPEFQRFADYYEQLAVKSKKVELQRAQALEQRTKELLSIKEQNDKQVQSAVKNQSKASHAKKKRASYCSEEQSDEEEEESEASEDEEYIQQDQLIKEIKKRYRVAQNVWILKPGENTNRGNGINVCSTMTEIKAIMQKAAGNPKTKDRTFIIQKYIDYPLLLNNRKFDFRCFGALTSINGHLKGYFYEDGYIRTSCKEYDINNLTNKFIHLTNDAVQQRSEDYGKFENGNKMSLQDFQKYLRVTHPDLNLDVKQHIMPQIRKLVADTFRAVSSKIDPGKLHNTFELFGYDFMIDEDFNLQLIEVNTNPCLEMSCPLLARIIPEVLDNTFRLVLDTAFPAPDLNSNRKWAVNEIPQEIKYTLVFDQDIEGQELSELYKNQTASNKEEIESDEEEELVLEEALQEEIKQENERSQTLDQQ